MRRRLTKLISEFPALRGNGESRKIAGEGAGKSAAKIRGAGGSAGEGSAPHSFPKGSPPPSLALPPAPRIFAALFPAHSPTTFQERKISPKRKFLGRTSRGHPGVIRADIPAQNFGQGGQNPGKNKHFGADIHDPKGRTSTTLRDFQKLRSEKLWAGFSFPNFPDFLISPFPRTSIFV